jgi:hypothetical protein
MVVSKEEENYKSSKHFGYFYKKSLKMWQVFLEIFQKLS